MRILVVDNYDSFVFNLVQYLGQLGVEAEVWRNDDARLADAPDHTAIATQFDGVLLSPGPGTPERAGLRAVQTPQGFETELLRRAYERAAGAAVTDDASLVEFLGTPVHTVTGDTLAFKITTPLDLQLAQALLT